jgi:methionyl-tRNA formyltransferase
VKTVVYTFESPVTLAVAERLVSTGKISALILQAPMTWRDKIAFLRRRVGRHGFARVADELLFQVVYALFLRRGDDHVREELIFDRTITKGSLAKRVDVFETISLNNADGRTLLDRLKPDLVVMMSREMIRRETLAAAKTGFIGCHPGLLPEYRGVYAPFWAMREGRPDQVGLSIYLANAGVDTGPLVAERTLGARFAMKHFKVESERVLLEGARDLIETIDKAERGELKTYTKPGAPSRLYSHVGLTHFLGALRHSSAGSASR